VYNSLLAGDAAKASRAPKVTTMWDLHQVTAYAEAVPNLRAQDGAPSNEAACKATVYRPVNEFDSTEIRVLEIRPGTFEDEIIGFLHHYSVGLEYPPVAEPAG
jgi:hypothetical protein